MKWTFETNPPSQSSNPAHGIAVDEAVKGDVVVGIIEEIEPIEFVKTDEEDSENK